MNSEFLERANAIILALEARELNATARSMRLLVAEHEASLTKARKRPRQLELMLKKLADAA